MASRLYDKAKNIPPMNILEMRIPKIFTFQPKVRYPTIWYKIIACRNKSLNKNFYYTIIIFCIIANSIKLFLLIKFLAKLHTSPTISIHILISQNVVYNYLSQNKMIIIYIIYFFIFFFTYKWIFFVNILCILVYL